MSNQPKASNSLGFVELMDSGKHANDSGGYLGLWHGKYVGVPFLIGTDGSDDIIFEVDEEISRFDAVPCKIVVYEKTARVTRWPDEQVNYTGFVTENTLIINQKEN